MDQKGEESGDGEIKQGENIQDNEIRESEKIDEDKKAEIEEEEEEVKYCFEEILPNDIVYSCVYNQYCRIPGKRGESHLDVRQIFYLFIECRERLGY